MDPVIHLSEGDRSDMLLDLSGLTREERVTVQASIRNNECDFDRVADVLIIQHPRIHLQESRKRAKGKGKDGFKRVDNSNTRWFFAEKAKVNTPAAENPKRVPITRTSLPLKITIIMMKTWMDLQTPIKPTMTQLTLEMMTEKKLWDHDDDEENDTFSSQLLWLMLPFSRQLNWMRLLFSPTHGTTILTLK